MNKEPNPRPATGKKPYSTPSIVSYGDITALTAAVGWMGAKDGGMFFMSRTS
jgi:hypothetical protein